MLISHAWLCELLSVDVAPDADTLAKILTGLGLEVEALHRHGAGVAPHDGRPAILVAEIRGKAPHPQAGKLTVVELFDGTTTLTVCCGASNLPPVGGKVAFAPIGAKLPGGLEIAPRELRGVASQGMICSETELEIGVDGDGILILPDEFPAGAELHTLVPGIVDTVLEINVTPNRPDALGHLGVARDVAAYLSSRPGGRAALRLPPLHSAEIPRDEALVTIAAPERCGRYLGYAIAGVKVGPSPLWLRVRLHRLGLRPISNLVDITNLVLMEFGQPLHAFDRAKLAEGRVVVRRANHEEGLRTLDGSDRSLDPADLVIADADDAQALAGVMGGAASMVSATTTGVLLEAAWFSPAGIRASARRHALGTDASYRYERGVDHGHGLERAALRALALIVELAGGRVTARAEALGERPPVRTLDLRPARAEMLLGVAVPVHDARAILAGLEIDVDARDPQRWRCTAPTHRPDLQREVDLIDELMRHHGLDSVPASFCVPREARTAAAADPMTVRGDRLSDGLREAGLQEIVSLAFVAEDKLLHFCDGHDGVPEDRFVRVANPMRGAGVLRTHLLPGLLDALVHNTARHGRPVRLFELGRTYAWPKGQVHPAGFPEGTRAVDVQLPRERTIAGLLLHAGGRNHADPRALTGAVAVALARLGHRLHLSEGTDHRVGFLHPGVQVRLAVQTATSTAIDIGVAGELHPDLIAAWGLPAGTRVAYGEIDLAALPPTEVVLAREIPRFPATSRDLSLEVPIALPAAAVLAALRSAAEPGAGDDPVHLQAEGIELLEDYRGAGVPDGHRALLLRLHYAAAARTLTDLEVAPLHAAIVERACLALRPRAPGVRPR
jgi:phenylalanyl-tRNA synthetase beta chain